MRKKIHARRERKKTQVRERWKKKDGQKEIKIEKIKREKKREGVEIIGQIQRKTEKARREKKNTETGSKRDRDR
jgi:hypothetical protein